MFLIEFLGKSLKHAPLLCHISDVCPEIIRFIVIVIKIESLYDAVLFDAKLCKIIAKNMLQMVLVHTSIL